MRRKLRRIGRSDSSRATSTPPSATSASTGPAMIMVQGATLKAAAPDLCRVFDPWVCAARNRAGPVT